MKAIIYTRVSSNEQVNGTSLEDQERKCRQYCLEKGLEVLKVFREEGESAKSSERTEFLRALAFCHQNKGKIDAFVVVKVDRFARNTEDHFSIRKLLQDYGTTLHSVTELIGNNPSQKFLETILAGTAEFDNAVRSQRSVDGMIARVRQGITPWKPPLGYLSNRSKMHGEKKNTADGIDPVVFPILQRALKRFSRGEIELSEICAYLKQEGLEKIRNRKTTKQMVDKMLGQYLKYYAGIIQNPWVKDEEIKGLHTAMITEDEMYQIIAIRKGKRIKKQPRSSFNPLFPLKKILRCGACNNTVTGSRSRGVGGQYGYYHCYTPDCAMQNKSLSKETVERDFMKVLQELEPTKQHLDLLRESVIDRWAEERGSFESDATKYVKQLGVLETKRKRICEMFEDGSYTKEVYQERKSEIENEMATIRVSMNDYKTDQLDVEFAITYATKFVEHLDQQWNDLQGERRIKFQKLIFPEGIPYFKGKGFGTTRISLILQKQKTRHDGESLVVTPRRIELRFTG